MKCTHKASESSHNCMMPTTGMLSPCKGCPTSDLALKYFNDNKPVLRTVPLL